MRTLGSILNAAKVGEPVTAEETLYALLAVEALSVFDHQTLRKLGRSEGEVTSATSAQSQVRRELPPLEARLGQGSARVARVGQRPGEPGGGGASPGRPQPLPPLDEEDRRSLIVPWQLVAVGLAAGVLLSHLYHARRQAAQLAGVGCVPFGVGLLAVTCAWAGLYAAVTGWLWTALWPLSGVLVLGLACVVPRGVALGRWHLAPEVAWFDLWVGIYVDRRGRRVYVLPLPCLGVSIKWPAPEIAP